MGSESNCWEKAGSQPLVSIIVPVYNTETYLRDCLDSVMNQSYANLEVILVDDGSSDGSGGILDEYEQKDDRLVVIHQENAGQSSARNVAMSVARGSYLAFLDSDDCIAPHHVGGLLGLALESDADISVGGFSKEYSELDLGDPSPVALYDGLKFLLSDNPLSPIASPAITGKLYKREVMEGMEFPLGRAHEDAMISHRTMIRATRVAVTPWKTYFYRVREASITNAPRTPKYLLDKAWAHHIRAMDLRGLASPRLLQIEYAKSLSHLMQSLSAGCLRGELPRRIGPDARDLMERLFANRRSFELGRRLRVTLYCFRAAPVLTSVAYSAWVLRTRK